MFLFSLLRSFFPLCCFSFPSWQEDVEVVLGEGQATEVLVVHVQHIAALFKSLQWAYKQNYFPFMQVPRSLITRM